VFGSFQFSVSFYSVCHVMMCMSFLKFLIGNTVFLIYDLFRELLVLIRTMIMIQELFEFVSEKESTQFYSITNSFVQFVLRSPTGLSKGKCIDIN